MGLFDDFSQFLETRLEEFLQSNPHLELQALEEQLREQLEDTQRLISQLQLEEQRLQDEILSVAQDIQTWHARVSKAKAAGRLDLAHAAQEREASLLRKGNQLWGQMEGVKQRSVKAKELLLQIKQRQQELKQKVRQAQATQATQTTQASKQSSSNWDTTGWNRGVNYSNYRTGADPLEQQFQNLEIDEELDQIKRNMGR